MARIPHAARVLIAQTQEKYKRAKAEPVGEPDGLDVHRAFRFDKTSSKWLAPILDAIDDVRIVRLYQEKDQLVVEFSDRHIADRAQRFPLTEVDSILND